MGEEAQPVVVPERVMGYTDRISYRPGDSVTLFVSTTAARWSGELLRLEALEIASVGVERRVAPVPEVSAICGRGVYQEAVTGSYARFPAPPPLGARGLTISFAAKPMRPGHTEVGPQVMLAHAADGTGWSIGLSREGRVTLTVSTAAGPASIVAGEPLETGCWVEIVARIPGSAGGGLELMVTPAGTHESNAFVRTHARPEHGSVRLGAPLVPSVGPLLWGCRSLLTDGSPQFPFDGRIEDPVIVGDAAATGNRAELAGHAAVLAAWDLAASIGPRGIEDTRRIVDAGPFGLHGTAVQHPHRLVTSSAFDGSVTDARFAPQHYAAIHFHRDDLTDAGWEPQAVVELPATLPSGVYGVRLTDDAGSEDLVPVFVAPRAGTATAPLLLVLPTNSYLAYANDHVGVDSPRTQVWSQMVPTLDDFELFRNARRDLGLSLYEVHGDSTPIFYSSWRRPILTMRERVYDHNAPVWQFTGDMQIVDWLTRTGRPFDIATDLDLQREGVELLRRYPAVMTGSHPEYASGPMLRAYEDYAEGGGRLMYMGGNGMYWVTGFDPVDEQVVEIRRWGATQAWSADPGEYHLSFTGEQGGIWRFRGRAPQKGFGVGFVAAGNPGASAGYHRATDDRRVSWVFDGVLSGEDRAFGDYGVSGAAAGLEVDSASPVFGSAPDVIVLATSVGHSDDMLEARENFNMTSRVLGGGRNPRVKSDLVLWPRANGGAVFSTGSIGFSGALYDLDGHTEVGALLGNIVDRFVSEGPILDSA